MSTTNNGNQNLTFDYKQSGTSQGFNRLFHKLISSGIVSGGGLNIINGTTVSIAPFIALVEDATKNLSVRLETTTNANVSVSVSTPYIVGRFSWLNVEDNYMDFEAVGYAELEDTDIIFGRCVYTSSVLTNIDYTRKSWAHMHYEQPNDEPPFITYMHEIENKLLVGKGSAYINGSLVEFNAVQESPSFDTAVTNGRIDLLVINASGNLEIIKGTDEENPTMPKIPYGTLAIAKVTLPRNPSKISGDMVEYIYNNHFQSQNSPTSIEQLSPEIQAIINQSFVQVGMVLPFAGPNVPTGYLLCDGRNVSKTTYARLYEVLKDADTGLCIYGEDSEEEGTFKLPDLRNRTVMGANPSIQINSASGNNSNVGDIQKASAPNIVGDFNIGFYSASDNNLGGAVYSKNTSGLAWGGNSYGTIKAGFDASRPTASLDVNGNNVYGAKETTDIGTELRPANIRMNWLIKY